MRTNLIRPIFAAALMVAFASAPALAQSLVKGKAVDSTGKPVPDTVLQFVAKVPGRFALELHPMDAQLAQLTVR